MPANPKYLTTSGWHRFAKIFAGLIGGYAISSFLHLIVALLAPDHKIVLITSIFTLYLVWMTLFIVPFCFKNGWKVLAIYVLSAVILAFITNYLKLQYPI